MFKFFRSRAKDPITSFKAADSITDIAKLHQDIIVDALKLYGPLGKDGIAFVTCLQSNQVARRMNELEKLDLIELTGEQVKSSSGRNERQWRFKPPKQKEPR